MSLPFPQQGMVMEVEGTFEGQTYAFDKQLAKHSINKITNQAQHR